MSEFVECQNCGRKILGENLVCPYCHGGAGDDADDDAVTDLMRLVAPHTPASSMSRSTLWIFRVLFHGFAALIAVVAIMVLAILRHERSPTLRAILVLLAAFAIVTLIGVLGRRRWGRWAAIAFIVWTAALSAWSVISTAGLRHLEWAMGGMMILLFLYPFLSGAARERFRR